MKVIELYNEIVNGTIKNCRFIFDKKVWQVERFQIFAEINGKEFSSIYNILAIANDEIEIIEEPKEELEEIELLDTREAYQETELPSGITKHYKWSLESKLQNEKINKLIENQNKIVRELKANSKQ